MSIQLSLRNLVLAFICLTGSTVFGQGTIKATMTVHGDGTLTEKVTEPDKRSTEETTKTSQGKVLRKTTYLLDDRSQPLGAVAYDGKGTVLYRSSYKRDGMNRIDEETVSNAQGQMIRRRVYQYGANNKVARVDEFDAAGNLIVPPRKSTARPDKKRRR